MNFHTDNPPDIRAPSGKTTHWKPEEYLLLDGRQMTYTVTRSGCMVHFIGGRRENLTDLRKAGHAIVEPKIWHRTEE